MVYVLCSNPTVLVANKLVSLSQNGRPAISGTNPTGQLSGNVSSATRGCRPSVGAQEATIRHDDEMDIDGTEKKRARLEAIALVARFCAWHRFICIV